jgi:hypothetical protein
MARKSRQYTTHANTYPTVPTKGGAVIQDVVGGQPGKKGMSKKKAKTNTKGKMVI